MSLLRLLTSGKSLVGGQDSISRYRVNGRKLLPKFNTKKNPFRAKVKPEPARAEFKVSQAPAKSDLAPLPEIPPSNSRCLPPGTDKKPAGEQVKAPRRASVISLARAKVGDWLGRGGSKMRGWLTRAPKRGKPAIQEFPKAPVQPELSLAAVKVVRNDLSDTDLELVPARTPGPKGSAAVGKAKPEVETPNKEKFELQTATATAEPVETKN